MPDMEFIEALRVGLRSDNRTDRNAQRLVAMQGLIPTEWGAKQLVDFNYPHSSPTLASILSWPHPTYHRVANQLLLFAETGIYTINESAITGAQGILSLSNPVTDAGDTITAGGGIWQTAGFGDQTWFATNGNSLVWKLPSNTPGAIYVAEAAEGFVPEVVARHGDRLVFGSFHSGSTFFGAQAAQWDELFDVWRENAPDNIVVSEASYIDDNYICYSQQAGGDYDIPFAVMLSMFDLPLAAIYDKFKPIIFSLVEQGQMGFYHIDDCDKTYALKEHNGDLIAYTDTKVSRLSFGEVTIKGRPGLGYREEVLLKQGVPGRGAVGGNDREHVFVTTQGEVYRLRAGEGLQRLGYEEFIDTLTLASIAIAHDEVENYYWIGDGSNGFCLTRTGLGGCDDVMVLSTLRSPGLNSLLGTGIAAASPTGAVVETEIFDGQMRQAWEIAYVDISTTDTDATGWQLKPKYRLDKSVAMTTKAAETFDQRGRVRTKTPGIDHALRLEASDRTKVDLERIFALAGRSKLSLRDLHDA